MSVQAAPHTATAALAPSRARRAFAFARTHKLLVVTGAIIVFYVLIALFGPLLAPFDPNQSHPGANYQAPGGEYLLGTDKQGRDVLSRMLYGARWTLLGALAVMLIAAVGGFIYGLTTAYLGGWFDRFSMRLFDLVLSFPPLVIAIVLVASLGPGLLPVVIGIGVGYLPSIARIIRSEALVQRGEQYVAAGRGLGFSGRRIVFRHMMPNCTSQIIVQASLNLPYAIIDIAGMSFLGFGIQPPTADWGAMLAEGQKSIFFASWLVLVPAVAIVVFVLTWNVFGAQLRRALDPKEA
ncbi:ABC transporter permease [Conexibacter sp. CPCC 206217]|uniref:ABC transporter permease n=1 Tax=Conexibacter sp. CPCC 206217 TaxID=3064574 RepID=UPI00271AE254|nr:ABC transporter permease [Conexibacter sp. CPCC 206217]MDO8212669.1 ABC transporter permease [Conexibacter sp. CPCC 206217]